MSSLTKHLSVNTVGRDYVVGDVHGCFTLLISLLDHVGFDIHKDRLLSVGDLVDRGPENFECLQLLEMPWFHGVMGNHELMMYHAFTDGPMGPFWLMNGGMWGIEPLSAHLNKHTFDDTNMRVIDLVMNGVPKMPMLITVDLPSGEKAHVIHAEFPPGADLSDELLADEQYVKKLFEIQGHEGSHFQWGRFKFGQLIGFDLNRLAKAERIIEYQGKKGTSPIVGKLGQIYSGHSIMHRPVTINGHTNLDTGAFCNRRGDKWAGLTMVSLVDGVFYQAKPGSVEIIEPLVLNNPEPTGASNAGT